MVAARWRCAVSPPANALWQGRRYLDKVTASGARLVLQAESCREPVETYPGTSSIHMGRNGLLGLKAPLADFTSA
eukprot:3801491-Pyramimonas_sp.AAC.1